MYIKGFNNNKSLVEADRIYTRNSDVSTPVEASSINRPEIKG
jgi:hypothetical protein